MIFTVGLNLGLHGIITLHDAPHFSSLSPMVDKHDGEKISYLYGEEVPINTGGSKNQQLLNVHDVETKNMQRATPQNRR